MRRRPQVGRSRRPEGETRALLLDALGTLLELEPPVEPLRRELRERFGVELSAAEAGGALRAEIAFYRAHHDAASDRARLGELRARSAAALRAAFPPGPARELPLAPLTEALLAALRFRPFAEVPAVLRALREQGVRLVVVSNWDVSLHDVLAETGLAPLLDGVVTSAEVGSAKPDGAIFARGLALAGAAAHEALHAGDSVEHDVAGARAAGIEPLLVARDGVPEDLPAGVRAIATLRPLLDRVGAGAPRAVSFDA
ncbi:MAG TPA: HAD family hydrolase [Conexibacter sp.]